MKKCTGCGETKGHGEYYRNRKAFDGLTQRCKKCVKIRDREYRENNKEAVTRRNRAWQEKNRERYSRYQKEYREQNRDSAKEYAKKYYADNKERLNKEHKANYAANKARYNELSRQNYRDNREKYLEKAKKWRESHREERSDYEHKRRAARNGADARLVSGKTMKRIRGMACARCGSSGDIHVDHIVPISRGGAHREGNLQPLCSRCNMSKGNKLMSEWKYKRTGTHY